VFPCPFELKGGARVLETPNDAHDIHRALPGTRGLGAALDFHAVLPQTVLKVVRVTNVRVLFASASEQVTRMRMGFHH